MMILRIGGCLTSTDKIESATETHPVTFVAFVVLESNKSLIQVPIIDRKEKLDQIIEPSESIITTPYVIGEGNHLFNITHDKVLIYRKRACQ